MKTWLHNKVGAPVRNALVGGVSPRRVALALAAGSALGLFPLLGVTTALCAWASFRFRLNLVVTQAANWIVAPLQVVLLLPFYHYGGRLLGAREADLSVEALRQAFATDWIGTLGGMWRMILGGVVLWAVLCLPAGWLFFASLHAVLKRWKPVAAEAAT